MLRKFAFALAIAIAAIAVRAIAGRHVGNSGFVILLVGVLFSAWVGGVGPSLITQSLILYVHGRFFAEGASPNWPPSPRAIANIGAFYLVGLVVATASDLIHRAQRRLRANAEQILRQREQFRAIVSCIADGVLVVDSTGRITLMNPEAQRMLRVPFSQVQGQPLQHVFRLSAEQIVKPPLDLSLAGLRQQEPIHSEAPMMLKTHDNQTVPITFSVAPVQIADNAPLGAVIVFRDETHRRHSEEALRAADRRKDEFLAMLAHELRNPLAPITMGLELMRVAPLDAQVQGEVRPMVERQVRHMVRLIDDLLDVSRITRGKLELRRSLVELHSVVELAVESSTTWIEQARHELVIDLPPRPLLLMADLDRLVQVLTNLLSNAAKYTPESGRICVRATEADGTVVITISDNGRGISPQMQSEIFEMFNQGDSRTDEGHFGLGIGLALAKRLVELHGGRIEAHSDGVGLGSTFRLDLPLCAVEPASAPLPTAGGTTRSETRRVLVVDDNRDSCQTTARLLQILGYEVTTALDGQEGLESAELHQPDAILMDLEMPRLDGFQAAERIRAKPWGKSIFLVAMTGWGQAADRERSKAVGFDEHLVKPLDLSVLNRLLAREGSAQLQSAFDEPRALPQTRSIEQCAASSSNASHGGGTRTRLNRFKDFDS